MLNVIIGSALVALTGIPMTFGLLYLAKKRQEESLKAVRVAANKRRQYHD